MNLARADRTHHADRGFTLVELIFAIVLSTVIGGVIVAALITSLTVSSATSEQVSDSTDASLIAAFLTRDAQSAGAIVPTTAIRDTTVGVSTSDWSGCAQTPSTPQPPPYLPVVRFSWIEFTSASAQSKVVVTYAFDSGTAQLIRRLCRDSAAPVDVVLARQLASVQASCEVAIDCTGTPTSVSLVVVGSGIPTPLAYTIKASLRGDTQATPTVVNSTPVPLLVLGAGGSVACPNLDLSGKTTGAVTVVGNALVDGMCGASPIAGNQTLLQPTGMTSTISGIVDPFRDRVPPTSGACASGGTNPATIGASANASAIVVYPQPVDLTVDTVFGAGRYVFCNGLKFTGGKISGADVLLYVASGTFDIAAGATVDLTGRTTGDTSMLVWVAAPSQTLTIDGGSRVDNLRGLIYAPTSRLQLSSTMAANIGGVNVRGLSVGGVGKVRIGLPLPALVIAPATLPSATVGVAYSATLSATGGTAPYRWCPPAVTTCAVPYSATGVASDFSIDATTGVISGTPPTAGTAAVVVTVFDATAQAASNDYSIVVDSGLGIFGGSQDVGSTGRPGQTSYSDPTFTVSVGKGGIGGTSDGFQFVDRSMTGDGRLTARVVSIVSNDNGAQAGVMFRESLNAGSTFAMMDITQANGGEFLYRNVTGGPTTVVTNASPPPPYWVRLTRFGNFITAEVSADGLTWTGRVQQTITMASTIYVGLAVATHNNSVTLGTASFDNVALTYPPPPAPVVTVTAASLAYTENSTMVLDGGVTATDDDGSTLVSASVAMTTGYVNGQDTLAFANQSGITGTWTSATGVLALSGSASLANYQTALRSITYNNNSDNPSTVTRTVTFVANDGAQASNTAGRMITVASVNDVPLVTATVATLGYTENGTSVLDAGITATDADSANLVSATVTITTNWVAAQDTLGFVTQNGITGTWTPATGVLALTGSSSVANYQTALRSITYNNNSDSPNTATRTVTLLVNDGTVNSNTASRTITLTAVNDAPVNSVPASQTTAKNVTKVFSSANGNLISISDIDAAAGTVQVQLVGTGGTITLSSATGLAFTAGDGTADATMTFTGPIATVNSRLAGLSFIPNNNFVGPAGLQIITNDQGNTGGGNLSDNDTIAITVANAPVVTASVAALPYTENGTTVLDAGITATDADSANLISAAVTMTTAYVNGQDTLAFVTQNGITATWTPTTGVLALSGSASVANYQTALRSITYNDNSDNPNTATRTVTFVVNDGALDSNTASRTITVTSVNDVPVVTATAASLAYTENGTTVLDAGITATDAENTTLASATVTITTNRVSAQDVLAFVTQNGITATWTPATGVLALSGVSSVANYQTALRSITYNNNSNSPNTATRTVTFVVNDGTVNSNTASRTITLTAVNDGPVVTATVASLAYTENGTTVLDAGITATDADSANLISAAVTMTTAYVNGQDTLAFVTQNGITATWTPATGVLALSGSASLANYQTALRSITYNNNSDNPSTATRTVTFVVNDGALDSNTASRTITVTSVNDVPAVTTSVATLPYTENGTTVLDAGIIATDAENTTLASATVDMTTAYVNGQDLLVFVPQNGITATWTSATGVLALSGVSSVANYQTALRSITYNNNSDSPNTATRTVTFVVNDGTVNSNTASRTITLTAVNDAPVNSVPGNQTTAKNINRVFSSGNGNLISISDVDVAAGTMAIQLVATNGTVSLSSTVGLTFIVGDGTADASMTFTGPIATVNSRLAGLSFIPTPNFVGAASLQIITNDLGGTGSGGALNDNETIAIAVI